jgi:serine/threonine protein kinase
MARSRLARNWIARELARRALAWRYGGSAGLDVLGAPCGSVRLRAKTQNPDNFPVSEDSQAHLAGFRMGALLAGYRLETQVGAGGMAVVFRARDERLDRLAALKILAPTLASDEQFRIRFIAESRAAAAVDDPFIIPVYDAGEADGVLFIAMQFVQGGDLHQVLEREGALTPERAAGFISPVASALDAAHRAGLVHRDVKPGNILVDAREDRPDHVYLSDFGVAKAASSAGLTGSGFFIGTPDYAAPEQIRGRAVDGRADQYALACVTFQLLTGAPPFRPDQDLPVLLAHVSTPPPSLTAQRADLPGAVDRVMARAMAKDAEDRYASCLDFADALREALGLPPFDPEGPAIPQPTAPARDTVTLARATVHPRRGTATVHPRRGTATRPSPVTAWIRRHRLPALALACATLAVIGAIAFVVASPAKSLSGEEPGTAARSPRPTTSASPASTPRYTSVPIKLPSPYAGEDIMSLAFSPAGTTLAIANGHHLCLWDIATNTGCRTSSAVTAANAVAFSSDGKTVAVGGLGGRVVLLNASTMALTAEFTDPGSDGVVSLAFSPDGKTVAAGDDNGNTYLWDVATGKAVTLTDPKSQGVRTVVFSPDGKTLAAGDLNHSVYLWDVASGKLAGTLTDPGSAGVNSTAFSPNGATVAAGDFNGRTYLWNVATKTVARVYPDLVTSGVNAVAFSPDGRLLAASDQNGAIFLWEAASVHLVNTLVVNEIVTAMAFAPDSKTLATGDENGDLTLLHIG